jgi:hypothetical protein
VAVAKTKKTETKKTRARRKGSAAAKKAPTKKSAAKSTESDGIVTVDRRSAQDRRTTPDRRKKSVPVAVERRKIERRAKVSRRRQIDPTTCERDYTSDEIEFMNALDEYKRSSGRMFPTCSEILEVIRKLGYERPPVGKPTEPAEADRAPEVEGPAVVRVEIVNQQEVGV